MTDDTPTERFDPNAADPNAPDPKAPASNAGGTPIDDVGDAPTRRLDQAGGDAPTEPFAPTGGSVGDQTPTERFSGPAGNDAPTERFAAAPPLSEPEPLAPAPGPRAPQPVLAPPTATKSRGPMIAFIVIVAVLVIAMAALLYDLATRDPETAPAPVASPDASEVPTPTPTPSETEPEASAEPTPEPTPSEEPTDDPGAAFTTFSPESGTPVSCPDETSSIPLTFEWTSTGADAAWIGVGTEDAKAQPFAQVDPSGVFTGISYQCANPSEIYTVTLDDGAGTLTHATVTLERALG